MIVSELGLTWVRGPPWVRGFLRGVRGLNIMLSTKQNSLRNVLSHTKTNELKIHHLKRFETSIVIVEWFSHILLSNIIKVAQTSLKCGNQLLAFNRIVLKINIVY